MTQYISAHPFFSLPLLAMMPSVTAAFNCTCISYFRLYFENNKKNRQSREQVSDWSARPLSDEQLTYAAADSAILVHLFAAAGLL
jgi:hypothetical protein